MKFTLKTLFCLILAFGFLVSCGGDKQDKLLEVVEFEPVLDLTNLEPEINDSDLIHLANAFSVDNEKNLYFLDKMNNRVLKFDIFGTFLMPIGDISGGKEELSNPYGIIIYCDELYVLDNYGQKIKKYSLTGELLSSCSLNKNAISKSFSISDNLAFVNEINKPGEGDSVKKLISIYSEDGKKQSQVGERHKVRGFAANLTFNSIYFTVSEQSIYGCFIYSPTFFSLDYSDKENVAIRDLTYIDEIEKIKVEGIERGAATPESVKKGEKSNRIAGMIYCYGFGIDDKKDIYYCTNYERASKGMIFCLDADGNLKKKMLLKFNNEIVRMLTLFIYKEEYLAIISLNEHVYLGRFQ